MLSSHHSFPAFRSWRGLIATALLLAAPGLAARAEMPDYVRAALNAFNPEPPAGWAYTLQTIRNQETRATARFEPTLPPDRRWTLVELNGQPAGPSDVEKYARARASDTTPASAQGAFQKRDIDPATLTLVSENAERAEFSCRFRAEATGADKMLGHLGLRLTISKRRPHVEKYVLELQEPYSPVLGVKMRELRVQATFSEPTDERPALPIVQTSHFVGRWFFIGMEENLELIYSDFARPR
jgi:hypothetical protein